MDGGHVPGSSSGSRIGSIREQAARHVDLLAVVGTFVVLIALLFGAWTLGSGMVGDSGWFCGVTNNDGTTVVLPAEPMLLDDFERLLTDESPCAKLDVELTVSGQWPPNTVIAPIGESVTFTKSEPIRVRVEATTHDFWLECGDFTGQRAGNFPSSSERERCDPAIQTRCEQDGVLQLCAVMGNNGRRCLTEQGHVTLTCGVAAVTCLDQTGRFVACRE